MKKRTKKGIFIVIIVVLVLSYFGREQGLMGMMIGFAAAIWIMNWAFNNLMPPFVVKTKKKIIKKIF